MKLIILITILLVTACSKDKESIPAPTPPPRELDKSFLQLGNVGETNASSTLVKESHVHTLDNDQMIIFVDGQTPGTIQITNFDEEEYNELEIGDVIIGNKVDQYLLTVKGVRLESDGKYYVKTVQASISELSKENDASISFTTTPQLDFNSEEHVASSDGLGQIKAVNNRIEINNHNIFKYNQKYKVSRKKLKFSSQYDGELTLDIAKGHIEIIPTFKGNINFKRGRLKDLNTEIHAYVSYDFELVLKASTTVKGKFTAPIFKDIKVPVRVPGPVPVWIDVIVSFPSGVNFNIKGNQEVRYRVSSHYALYGSAFHPSVNGENFAQRKDYIVKERSLTSNQGQTSANIEFFFSPKIQARFYRVLGPYAQLSASIGADLILPLLPEHDEIYLNFTGRVGASFVEPIFETKIKDFQSPDLFNLRTGWDILKPGNNKKDQNDSSVKDGEVYADSLDADNKITLKLKPGNMHESAKVIVSRQPEYGKLVLDDNFLQNSLAYYYPPNVVEGQDSFDVKFQVGSKLSDKSRIKITLGDDAKEQAKNRIFSVSGTPQTTYKKSNEAVAGQIHQLPNNIYSIHGQTGLPEIINNEGLDIMLGQYHYKLVLSDDCIYDVRAQSDRYDYQALQDPRYCLETLSVKMKKEHCEKRQAKYYFSGKSGNEYKKNIEKISAAAFCTMSYQAVRFRNGDSGAPVIQENWNLTDNTPIYVFHPIEYYLEEIYNFRLPEEKYPLDLYTGILDEFPLILGLGNDVRFKDDYHSVDYR